jgi:hypothetical protein
MKILKEIITRHELPELKEKVHVYYLGRPPGYY